MQANDAQSFDLAGLTLLPGLIDAHVHVTAVTADLAVSVERPSTHILSRAVVEAAQARTLPLGSAQALA